MECMYDIVIRNQFDERLVAFYFNLFWHSTKHGLDWTGQLDWTVGLDNWTGQLDWTAGLDSWTGLLDWNSFLLNTCNSMFLKKTK